MEFHHITELLLHYIKGNYSLSTGESYSPTAKHMQGCPIFFIQLNYVYNNKEIKCCHLMLNSPATKWHQAFYFLFLNSAILDSCNFGHCCLYLLIFPSIIDTHQLFCWIVLVCIYKYAFRHILGLFTLLFCI